VSLDAKPSVAFLIVVLSIAFLIVVPNVTFVVVMLSVILLSVVVLSVIVLSVVVLSVVEPLVPPYFNFNVYFSNRRGQRSSRWFRRLSIPLL
jgi:hypothetical protein